MPASSGFCRCAASDRPKDRSLRVTLIVNPVSGGGGGKKAAGRARIRFEAEGHEVRSLPTSRTESAHSLARSAIEAGADLVVAIGGDGTVTDVATAVAQADRPVPMAIVPRGTANVLALNLGIPRDPDAAIATAIEGVAIRIDAGRVNGEIFLVSAATGSHAEMVAAADRRAKSKWGVVAYGLAWLRSRRTLLTPARYRITADGDTHEIEATMIQVMNCGAVFRRGWEFAPGVSPVDGQVDAIAYRATSVAEYLTAAAYVLGGAPTGTRLVDHWRAPRFVIEATPPVRLQRDGELAGMTPAEIEVDARRIPVLVPRGGPWTS